MAGLNLDPNPTVLVTQAGIFLASLYTVKKLMVEPYLKVKHKRDGITFGSKKESDFVLEQNILSEKLINEKLAKAHQDARQIKMTIAKKAKLERERLTAEARDEANHFLDSVDKGVERDLENARHNLPSLINEIAAGFYTKVTQDK